jgi:small conductance mechanosensitive channel
VDIGQQWSSAANTAVALVTSYGLSVVGAIVILVAGWMGSRVIYAGIVRLCARTPRIDRTITLFLANGARYAVLVFTFTAVLSTFGVATTSFVAVLGALGIAIGLALQGTLSNLAAGIMLVLFRPFHIGDRIEAVGALGTVREINLFYSEVDTDSNVRAVIPNGKLWGEVVKVHSRNDTERIEVKFTRPLAEDIDATVERLREIVANDHRVRQLTQVGVEAINETNYVLVARLWVRHREAMQVHFDINRAMTEGIQRGKDDDGKSGDVKAAD